MRKMHMMLGLIIFLFVLPSLAFAWEPNYQPSDIQNHKYRSAIEWGILTGIVEKANDGKFRPDDLITKEEFFMMYSNLFLLPVQETPNPRDGYYNYAIEHKIPIFNDKTDATTSILRKQIAELLIRSKGLDFKGDDAIWFLLVYQQAVGKNGQYTIEDFKGDETLTRSEALLILKHYMPNGPRRDAFIDKVQTIKPLSRDVKITQRSLPFLLPSDPVSQPSVDNFIKSIKIENGILNGVIPPIPKGYRMSLVHQDLTKKFVKPTNYKHLKPGDKLSIPLTSSENYISLSYDVDNEILNGVSLVFSNNKVQVNLDSDRP